MYKMFYVQIDLRPSFKIIFHTRLFITKFKFNTPIITVIVYSMTRYTCHLLLYVRIVNYLFAFLLVCPIG